MKVGVGSHFFGFTINLIQEETILCHIKTHGSESRGQAK